MLALVSKALALKNDIRGGRMFMRIFITLVMIATSISADVKSTLLPYYYRVINVASDDVLNLRDEPSASSAIKGSIAWDEGLVTVTKLSQDGKWGLVPSDGDHWVNMKYLEPIELEVLPDTRIPIGLTCFGWDPTWSVTFSIPHALVKNIKVEEEIKSGSYSYDYGKRANSISFSVSTRTDNFNFEVSEELCETTASSKFPYSVRAWDNASNQPLNQINGKPLYGGECCSISKLYTVLK